MARPEKGEEVGVGADRWVEVEADHFGVAGVVAADVFVGGIGEVALGVTHLRLDHALQALEGELHTPEASRRELRQIKTGLRRRIHVRRQGRVRRCFLSRSRSHSALSFPRREARRGEATKSRAEAGGFIDLLS